MKTRKRPVINNLADLERRPSRQFTDTVKTLIAEKPFRARQAFHLLSQSKL